MLGRSLCGGEMISLYGDLGTGKTAFVRGIAAGLDAPPRAVSSPTFVLVHTYMGRLPLAHADLYRLEKATELRHLGLEDYFDDRTVVAVEWAEKAQDELPSDRLEVHFVHVSRTRRRIHFRTTGSQSQRLLTRIMAAQAEHATQNSQTKKRNMGPKTGIMKTPMTSKPHRGTERRR